MISTYWHPRHCVCRYPSLFQGMIDRLLSMKKHHSAASIKIGCSIKHLVAHAGLSLLHYISSRVVVASCPTKRVFIHSHDCISYVGAWDKLNKWNNAKNGCEIHVDIPTFFPSLIHWFPGSWLWETLNISSLEARSPDSTWSIGPQPMIQGLQSLWTTFSSGMSYVSEGDSATVSWMIEQSSWSKRRSIYTNDGTCFELLTASPETRGRL